MLKIIANIPLFVWPLFVFLLIGGLKARKANGVPLKVLIGVPAAFFVWSLVSFFGRYATDSLAVVLWTLCLGLGFFIGFFHIQRLKLGFDKKKKLVEMPGSWIPLVLSMSIFAAKFSVGMMRSMFVQFEDSMLFLGLELFATVVLGIFVGRATSCFYRYRSTEVVKYNS